jgi:ribosomal protein S18 acetylase RimI-like enzyme
MGADEAESITIREAGPADLATIREMLLEYQRWLGVDLSFQGFAHEVEGLPGDYTAPDGALLIARRGAEVAGMVALRRLDATRGEMKRLFVRGAARGTGVGRELVARIVGEARARGYQSIVLDTLPKMQSAQRMYEQFGFRDVPPYYQSAIPGTRYMALALAGPAVPYHRKVAP